MFIIHTVQTSIGRKLGSTFVSETEIDVPKCIRTRTVAAFMKRQNTKGSFNLIT